MAEYYLIAQLPSLDGLNENSPVPIGEKEFLELCSRFLSKKALSEVQDVTLVPSLDKVKSSSALINAWNEGERDLRLALAKVRADKMDKPFNFPNKTLPIEMIKAANEAIEKQSPLEAENFLLQYRLNFLETLRPIDNFSNEFILYYALKLKLLLRVRKFDSSIGQSEYNKIYHSIINGDSEVK